MRKLLFPLSLLTVLLTGITLFVSFGARGGQAAGPAPGAVYAAGQAAASESLAVRVNGMAVPPFSITVNHVKVTQRTMVSYPLYSAQAGAGTANIATYAGYSLADVFDAVGISGSYATVTVTDENGKSIQISADLAADGATLLALTKNGARFEKAPWFAPCGSNAGGQYMDAAASIEANGAKVALPLPAPDPEDMFGVDLNINMETIDFWLGRDDVVYRDMRLLFDPADFEKIGGISDLTQTIEGFTIVPYPYIATLSALPVPGGYKGRALFTIAWHEDGSIASVKANYLESMVILEELFPIEKPIFLMCGGAGYSNEMRALLRYLGWNQDLLYVVGPNWTYRGKHAVALVLDSQDPEVGLVYATWRADYVYFDFDRLHTGARLVERAELKPIDPMEPTCILDILAAKRAAESS